MTIKEDQVKNYKIDVHDLGITEYDSVWSKMKNYSRTRNINSSDLIWFTEHHAIYTLGQNGKDEHIINPGIDDVFIFSILPQSINCMMLSKPN